MTKVQTQGKLYVWCWKWSFINGSMFHMGVGTSPSRIHPLLAPNSQLTHKQPAGSAPVNCTNVLIAWILACVLASFHVFWLLSCFFYCTCKYSSLVHTRLDYLPCLLDFLLIFLPAYMINCLPAGTVLYFSSLPTVLIFLGPLLPIWPWGRVIMGGMVQWMESEHAPLPDELQITSTRLVGCL